VELFERTWQESVDIVGAELAGNEPTEIERQVLGLLARVDKDEAAARELGVSLRTFQRHLANVMARLNTTSRFQAALSAKERGWI
jgi:DNA-binding NarL/FixJ family response regulator